MRLHTRLLLSYIVVIAVTLSVITVALLFFLNARPAPPQNVYRQLATSAQVNLRNYVRGRGAAAFVQSRMIDELTTFSDETGIRTLLVASPESPRVIFDSSGGFAPDFNPGH